MRVSLLISSLGFLLTHPAFSTAEATHLGGIDSGGGISLVAGLASISTIGSVFSDSPADGASGNHSGLVHLLTPDAPPPADVDGNGLPDAWEALHGLNAGSEGGQADTDGDGTSDLFEYILGTNPRHAAPHRSPDFSMHPTREGVGSIEFPTVPGRIYRVWSSPTLQPGSWTQLWTALGAGQALRFETTNDGPTRFYQITVNPFR